MGSSDSQVVEITNRNYWSLSQLSEAFGPARETVSKRLKASGVHSSRKRGGHDVFHIAEAARAILAGEMPSYDGVEDPDKLPPKERLDYFKGENEKKKFLADSGQLVPADEVRIEMANIMKICLRTIETLPDILELKCSLDAEGVQVVQSACDRTREDLAEQLAE